MMPFWTARSGRGRYRVVQKVADGVLVIDETNTDTATPVYFMALADWRKQELDEITDDRQPVLDFNPQQTTEEQVEHEQQHNDRTGADRNG